MKLGIEAEGRFKGLQTLFMSAAEFLRSEPNMVGKKLDYLGTPPVIEYGALYSQIYVSDHANEIGPDHPKLKLWMRAHPKMPITLEVTDVGGLEDAGRTVVRSQFPPNVHLMLLIESEPFWALRPGDQVKFSTGQEVYAVTKECMSHTVPEDFAGDIEL